jgi:hypothetical protein
MPVFPESASLSEFGGVKSNYFVAPVDPTTDIDEDNWNYLICNAAMGSRMQPRCEAVFTGHATTPVFVEFEAVWKGGTATSPVIARTGSGVFTVTYPASVNDELGEAHSVNLKRAWGQAEGTTSYTVQCSASANVVTVRVFLTSTGAANDAADVTLVVWAR